MHTLTTYPTATATALRRHADRIGARLGTHRERPDDRDTIEHIEDWLRRNCPRQPGILAATRH